MYVTLIDDGKAKRGGGNLWRLQVGHVDARQTIRIGTHTRDAAHAIAVHVRRLSSARLSGEQVHRDTTSWVKRIDDKLHSKLATVGLVTARQSTELAGFLDDFIAAGIGVQGRPLKPSGIKKLRQARSYLVAFFGERCRLQDITVKRASDWYRWLLVDDTDRPPEGQHPIGRKPDGTPIIKAALSLATARTAAGYAKTLFAVAERQDCIHSNPFRDLSAGTTPNTNYRIVTREDALLVLAEIEDVEIRLFFALARFAGMRMPSEGKALTWADVDFERSRLRIRSLKTEHHAGEHHRRRDVPIDFVLADAFEKRRAACKKNEPPMRLSATGHVRRVIAQATKAAGVEPWEDQFQTLRSSCESDWCERFPAHVVHGWLGHSSKVAMRHYLNKAIKDEFFEAAASPLRAMA